MKTASEEIKRLIISKNEEFYSYLTQTVINSTDIERLHQIYKHGEIYLFSGVIRDYFLGKNLDVRDLDFVFRFQDLFNFRVLLRNLNDSNLDVRFNSFKGLKIKLDGHPDIDCWLLQDTWGIKHKKQDPTINALLDSAFFNFSAIAYDIKNHKFIFSENFVNFLTSKEMDVVMEENPNIPLCLYNIYHYSQRLHLRISDRLKNWILRNYSSEINFDKIQEKHNGHIEYTNNEIHNFLKNIMGMRYGIKWEDYLSSERIRKTTARKNDDDIDKRNPFESDFGRVVFSSPIRRMHDKTQVIPLTSGDNIHTRLTHSLEVMNTAKSLAANLCRDRDFIEEYGLDKALKLERDISSILMTAGLVHDIGNPPFGHFGETVIKDYFKRYFENSVIKEEYRPDFSEFDGNAQGLRILTHLSYVGDLAGLNLTYATLAAYMKYPNPSKVSKKYIGTKKHGVYYSEQEAFNKIVDACHLRVGEKVKRHPLSFMVEAADSICYLSMDIEDGYNLKWFDRNQLIEYLDKEITKRIKEKETHDGKEYADRKFMRQTGLFSFMRIITKNPSLENFGDKVNDGDWILKFRVALIQYLVEKASFNFKRNSRKIDEGNYSEELIEDDDYFVAKTLQEFTRRHILSQPEIQKVELTGHEVISGLLRILIAYVCHSDDSFRTKVKAVLSKSALRVAIHEQDHREETYHFFDEDELFKFDVNNLSEYAKLRLVVDFISGMTDKFAISLYQQLIGIKY